MTSSSSPSTSLPKGDLLITRDTSERQGYIISTIPGPAQIRYRTYDQALASASTWAADRRVGVWFTDDGASFKPASSIAADNTLTTHTQPAETATKRRHGTISEAPETREAP